MNKYIISFVLCLFFLSPFITDGKETDIKVVATTTHISTILNEIGRDRINVINLVPGGMCPGHFDIEPEAVKKITEADLIIHHGWETWINKITEINQNLMLKKIQTVTKGNWMIPEINLKAADELLNILIKADKRNEQYYKDNYAVYRKSVEKLTQEIRKKRKQFYKIKVICSVQQSEFVSWLGFKILTVYSRIEDINIKELKRVISIGKKENVALVIDNLQSGPKTGEQIAKDIKAKHTVLTNFPIDLSYIDTVKYNLDRLNKVLNE